MTMTAPPAPFGYYDENTRAYLASLQSGQRPDIRPEFGRWEPVVRMVEDAFSRANGNKSDICRQLLGSMVRSKKYPGLSELLVGEAASAGKMITGQSEENLMPALPKYAYLPPALAQHACPELDWYEAFSKKASERGYAEYHQFCGLWMFSVIAGRRVSLQIKKKLFYTNLMIAQCGTTSFYAKSFTANIAKQMLYELGLGYLLAPNRITPQKLLSDMAGAHIPVNFDDLAPEKQDRIRRRLGMPGQKGLLFDELGLFIQSMLRKQSVNADFADLLLTFDECPPEYENATIVRGGEPIEKPYLTLLGNMTPANLKQNAKAGADFWHDGFWARISFVVAPPPPKDQEDPGPPQVSELDDLDLPFPSALLQSLRDWNERLGVPVCHLDPKMKGDKIVDGYDIRRGDLPESYCTITTEARQAWTNYDHALRQLCLKLPHDDFNGSYVRLAETAMRMAVLMASLSNGNIIDLRIWAKAQELAEILRRNLHELYAQVNASDEKPSYARSVEDKILAYVEKYASNPEDKEHIPTSRNLSRYVKAESALLRSTLVNLEQIGRLKKARHGKAEYYVLGDDG